VVDDDSDSRALLREILEDEGYSVVEAADGLEALERLKAPPVDLVVTDRAMPKLDGMALLAKLHELHATLPVLMISGYGEETLWGQAIGRGAKDYLLKPFKAEVVLAQIKKYLPGKS